MDFLVCPIPERIRLIHAAARKEGPDTAVGLAVKAGFTGYEKKIGPFMSAHYPKPDWDIRNFPMYQGGPTKEYPMHRHGLVATGGAKVPTTIVWAYGTLRDCPECETARQKHLAEHKAWQEERRKREEDAKRREAEEKKRRLAAAAEKQRQDNLKNAITDKDGKPRNMVNLEGALVNAGFLHSIVRGEEGTYIVCLGISGDYQWVVDKAAAVRCLAAKNHINIQEAEALFDAALPIDAPGPGQYYS